MIRIPSITAKPLLQGWFFWALLLGIFQVLIATRITSRPIDQVLPWTASETGKSDRDMAVRLAVPVFGEHVAWDSEFYLSIALAGYDDPVVRKVRAAGNEPLSLNYAFMPLYPMTIRAVMQPMTLLGIHPTVAATMSGIFISLLGALFAALALFDLVSQRFGKHEGLKAAWFLLIFPTGFFLAQVYTEALFLALSLWSLALARREKWMAVAITASLAILTRAAGVALVPAIAVTVALTLRHHWQADDKKKTGSYLGMAEAILIPLATFLIWKFSFLGQRFDIVETAFFGRSFNPVESFHRWMAAFGTIGSARPDRAVYFALELASLLLALGSTVWGTRKHPDLAIFGLAVLTASFCSMGTQGLIRYVLACPLIFVMLASRSAKSETFEQSWTLGSVLLMALLAALFSLDMWVG